MPPTRPPRDPWHTIRGWHGESTLYREIYARTVSALIAALVIYLIAAAAGVVTRKPLTIIGLVMLLPSLPWFLLGVLGTIRYWTEVRPLFVRWNDREDPVSVYAKTAYTRLTFAGWITGAGVFILVLGAVTS